MNDNSIKPIIVVSTCLGFEATRYNGDMLDNAFVRRLRNTDAVQFKTVCPEVAIGLGIPRETLRIVMKEGEKRLIQPKTGRDVSDEMTDFANKFTNNLVSDGFIFKADSPSVGTDRTKVYPSEDAYAARKGGAGFFTSQIIEMFPNYPIQSDRRLRNTFIQDSFLIKVYTVARFRIKIEKNKNKLEEFHKENYYLLVAHDPELAEELAKIIHKSSSIEEKIAEYKRVLLVLLKNGTKREHLITSFEKIIKELELALSDFELQIYRRTLENFKVNAVSKNVMLILLESFASRTGNEELVNQTIFKPYPLELVIPEDPLDERFLINAYDVG